MKKTISREKLEYLKSNGYCYFAKEEELPEFNSDEFKFLTKMVTDKRLVEMGKDIKIIKKCIIFFTALTAISVLWTIISVMSLINSL